MQVDSRIKSDVNMKKINKVICFLCKDIKLVQGIDWKSCVAHGKEHGIEVKELPKLNLIEDSQSLLLKLPNGNTWAVAGS